MKIRVLLSNKWEFSLRQKSLFEGIMLKGPVLSKELLLYEYRTMKACTASIVAALQPKLDRAKECSLNTHKSLDKATSHHTFNSRHINSNSQSNLHKKYSKEL